MEAKLWEKLKPMFFFSPHYNDLKFYRRSLRYKHSHLSSFLAECAMVAFRAEYHLEPKWQCILAWGI